MVLPWFFFVVSAGAIIFAGTKLLRYGNRLPNSPAWGGCGSVCVDGDH